VTRAARRHEHTGIGLTASDRSVRLSPQPRPQTNDCSVPSVRDRIGEEIWALPFLGTLHCSAERLIAGGCAEIVLTYTVGASGIADSGGLKLCFKYYSDWNLQTEDPGGRDYASVELVGRGALGGAPLRSAFDGPLLRARYDVKGGERPYQKALIVDLVDGYLQPGDTVAFRLGDRRFGGPGTRVQTFVQDEFVLRLSVDVLGTGRWGQAGACRLMIAPGPPDRLVVHGPRVIRAGSSAELRAHIEDRWGNACAGVPAALHASIAERPLEASSTPEHGWAVAALRTPALPAGSATIDVRAECAGGPALSASCHIDAVYDLPGQRAYFADLHVHSDDTVGTQDTAWNLAYGREIGGLDILGYTGNDFQITDEAWSDVVAQCRAATQADRFVCFPGVEWCGNSGVGGDHNVVFLGEDTTLARSMEWHAEMAGRDPSPATWPIAQLYAAYEHDPEAYLLIPHVGGRRAMLDWHHPGLERLIEIHSTWGTSPWFYEEALRRGLRLGASGASDEHRGRPGSGAPGANIFGMNGGLTGVLAAELNRSEVARSLRARRTWATTGARAVALLRSGDHWMGDEVRCTDEQITAHYALYGTSGWETLCVCDATGELVRRNLHAEVGLSEDLVRIRWGGARHRDRYRWATWRGSLRVSGAAVLAAEPWAQTHPEQRIVTAEDGASWETVTYGGDIGLVLRVDDLAAATFDIEALVLEGGLRQSLKVNGQELIEETRSEAHLGELDLHVRVERIADPEKLPARLTGRIAVGVPAGDSALYVRGLQWDGHQVWTSPMFFTRKPAEQEPCASTSKPTRRTSGRGGSNRTPASVPSAPPKAR
jgi:hypothetical protein